MIESGTEAGRHFDSPGAVQIGGPQSTDFIPILWAERILTQLRDEHAGTWRRLLGAASTGS